MTQRRSTRTPHGPSAKSAKSAKRRFAIGGSLAALVVGLALPGTVAAQECETDADCMQGMVCVDAGPAPCPAIACAPGEDCEDIECSAESVSFCQPAPCESDEDCGDDLRCKTFESMSCPGSPPVEPCPDDQECEREEPERVECETETYSECVPAWTGECAEDADCGPGFTCTEAESCWCSAGSAGPGEDAPVESECGCEPSGHFYCELNEVECQEDADCDNGLECQEVSGGAVADCAVAVSAPEPAPAQGGAGGGSDSGGDSSSGTDGEEPDEDGDDIPDACEPEVVEPRSLCVPPNYLSLSGFGGSPGIAEAADLAGNGQAASTGAVGGTRAQGVDADDSGAVGDGAATSGGSGDGAGLLCSAAPGVAGAQGLWLALGPALLWLRRRRGC